MLPSIYLVLDNNVHKRYKINMISHTSKKQLHVHWKINYNNYIDLFLNLSLDQGIAKATYYASIISRIIGS